MEKYEKFKDCSLPAPFYNKEKDILEYVWYDKTNAEDKLNVSYSIANALEDFAMTSLYYSFKARHLTGKLVDDKWVFEERYGQLHEHDFESVVKYLYQCPESFKITDDDKEFYSKRELAYLDAIQRYLLFIGLKDDLSIRKSYARYKNKKALKYANSSICKFSNEEIDLIIKGQNYIIIDYYEGAKNFEFKEGFNHSLVLDENLEFRLFIERINDEICEDENSKYIKENFKVLEIIK